MDESRQGVPVAANMSHRERTHHHLHACLGVEAEPLQAFKSSCPFVAGPEIRSPRLYGQQNPKREDTTGQTGWHLEQIKEWNGLRDNHILNTHKTQQMRCKPGGCFKIFIANGTEDLFWGKQFWNPPLKIFFPWFPKEVSYRVWCGDLTGKSSTCKHKLGASSCLGSSTSNSAPC